MANSKTRLVPVIIFIKPPLSAIFGLPGQCYRVFPMPVRATLLCGSSWQRALEDDNQQHAISLQVDLVCHKDSRREGLEQGTGKVIKATGTA